MLNNEPIDAAIAWVNGSDPKHIRKKIEIQSARKNVSPGTILAGLDDTRFTDNGEIEYCIKSIRMYAPWIRNIFLITDDQRPDFLTQKVNHELNVTIIDHREIFSDYEWALPTFNSLSIETVLWRTPGLSNKFIYFNDDMMFLKPVSSGDFFESGKVVLRGHWNKLEKYGHKRWIISQFVNRVAKHFFNINRSLNPLQQMLGARLADMRDEYFKSSHTPYPMQRDTLETFYRNNSDQLTRNIQYRFRNRFQYATTSLANHLEFRDKNAVARSNDDSAMICFNRDSEGKVQQKAEAVQEGLVRFFCIQSLEQANTEQREMIRQILVHANLA